MGNANILDISLYQIQLFLSVADEKNFSRAAERMNLTQPTLSKRIFSLEDILGFSLFDRKKRPVELTAAGNILYNEWRGIVKRFEETVEKTRTHAAAVNTLIIGIIDSSRTFAAFSLAARHLEDKFPGTAVMREYKPYNRWRETVMSGEVDIMFVLSLEKGKLDEKMEGVTVITCPKLVAVLKTNPLSKKAFITYDDLRDQKFIVNSVKAMPSHYEFIRSNTLKYGFEPEIARFTQATHDLIGNLKGNDEVVICDMFLREIESDALKLFELPDTYSGLVAVWSKDNRNPYIRHFVKLVEEYFREEPPIIP